MKLSTGSLAGMEVILKKDSKYDYTLKCYSPYCFLFKISKEILNEYKDEFFDIMKDLHEKQNNILKAIRIKNEKINENYNKIFKTEKIKKLIINNENDIYLNNNKKFKNIENIKYVDNNNNDKNNINNTSSKKIHLTRKKFIEIKDKDKYINNQYEFKTFNEDIIIKSLSKSSKFYRSMKLSLKEKKKEKQRKINSELIQFNSPYLDINNITNKKIFTKNLQKSFFLSEIQTPNELRINNKNNELLKDLSLNSFSLKYKYKDSLRKFSINNDNISNNNNNTRNFYKLSTFYNSSKCNSRRNSFSTNNNNNYNNYNSNYINNNNIEIKNSPSVSPNQSPKKIGNKNTAELMKNTSNKLKEVIELIKNNFIKNKEKVNEIKENTLNRNNSNDNLIKEIKVKKIERIILKTPIRDCLKNWENNIIKNNEKTLNYLKRSNKKKSNSELFKKTNGYKTNFFNLPLISNLNEYEKNEYENFI